ncbi:MAG: LysR family transcriptional regulator [Stenotrophobium sp.]
MQDLNDLYFFAQVVEHGGFAAAGRALGQPKSKLSRRIAQLEQRLGVRLIQRSSRQFSVTDVGRNFYGHCKAMLVEAEAAQAAVEQTRAEPCGVIRLSCPVALLHACVGTMLAAFMAANPRVELHLDATNRRVDVIGEGLDIAIRARRPPLEDSDLVVKSFGERAQWLVASPALLEQTGPLRAPADLSAAPSLDLGPPRQEYVWHLEGPDGAQAAIRHRPRLVTDDMMALRNAVLTGIGVVQLPALLVGDDIKRGDLVHVVVDWAPRCHVVHAVYPSKRGLLPSVRALLDFLAVQFEAIAED